MQEQLPDKTITVGEYKELRGIAESFLQGRLPFLLLIGPPGTGKGELLRRTCPEIKRAIIESHVTTLALYQQAYLNIDLPLVLDDLDGLYARGADIRLLKCLCETKTLKTLAWYSTHKAIGDGPDQTPARFETKSPVCLITNKWRTLNDNVAAINSRATMILPGAVNMEQFYRAA